jgi:acyl carrier protein
MRLGGQAHSTTTQPPADPPQPPIAPIASGPSPEELQAYLVNFVVEQTGYPDDFITLDADLEGDLGIDSIKKAQLLGELNEMFHFSDLSSEQDSNMSLDNFATLRDISSFILMRLGGQL